MLCVLNELCCFMLYKYVVTFVVSMGELSEHVNVLI